jgi:hypothetical protein
VCFNASISEQRKLLLEIVSDEQYFQLGRFFFGTPRRLWEVCHDVVRGLFSPVSGLLTKMPPAVWVPRHHNVTTNAWEPRSGGGNLLLHVHIVEGIRRSESDDDR